MMGNLPFGEIRDIKSYGTQYSSIYLGKYTSDSQKGDIIKKKQSPD